MEKFTFYYTDTYLVSKYSDENYKGDNIVMSAGEVKVENYINCWEKFQVIANNKVDAFKKMLDKIFFSEAIIFSMENPAEHILQMGKLTTKVHISFSRQLASSSKGFRNSMIRGYYKKELTVHVMTGTIITKYVQDTKKLKKLLNKSDEGFMVIKNIKTARMDEKTKELIIEDRALVVNSKNNFLEEFVLSTGYTTIPRQCGFS